MIDLKFSSTSLFSVAVCLLFLLIALPNHGNAQEEEVKTSRWELNLDLGIEEHDKRLGSFPGRAALLESQSEFFGTYSIMMGAHYQLSSNEKLEWSIGLNHVYSLITFMRPWDDRTLPDDILRPLIIEWTDRYQELMLAPSFSLRHKVTKRVYLGGSVQSRFRYHLKTSFRGETKEYFGGAWNTQLRSVEGYIDLSYLIGDRLAFTGRYRAIQYHRNDTNLINRYTNRPTIGDPPPPKYEWFNPVKLVVGLSYRL